MVKKVCGRCKTLKCISEFYFSKGVPKYSCKKCDLKYSYDFARRNKPELVIENLSCIVDDEIVNEEWKPIIGYEGLYEISNFGRIKTLKRKFVLQTKLFKQQTSIYGYYIVTLNKGNKETKNYLVHILVAKHFIPNPQNKPEVNHKKGIKKDNRFFELEWSTKLENVQHAFSTGLVCHKGVKNANCKLSDNDVIEIFNSTDSYKELSERYAVNKTLISSIKTGSRWGHLTKKKHIKRVLIKKEQVEYMLKNKLSAKDAASFFGVPAHRIRQLKNRKEFKCLF